MLSVHQARFLTGLQVFRNPGISVCDNETERGNSIGEYTAGSGHNSEMMAGDTAMNVTRVICGKP